MEMHFLSLSHSNMCVYIFLCIHVIDGVLKVIIPLWQVVIF